MDELTDSLKGLRDLFFSRRCNVCDKVLDLDETGLCRECFSDMPFTYFWDWGDNPAFCKLSSAAPVKAAAALFHFRPEAGYNGIMHSIKYRGNRRLGYRLGWLLGDFLLKSSFPNPDVVVPVPLHPLRLFRRGFNQAEVIADGVAAAMGVEVCTNLLRKTRFTTSQVKLSTEKKKENIRGAFKENSSVSQKMVDKGVRHILIVDDTMTTGATLSECCNAVSEYFSVSAAALAYSD